MITDDWIMLTETLDYHHKKWYQASGLGWVTITKRHARNLIEDLLPEEDPDHIMRQFSYRDSEAHARSKGKHEAQLALGDWR